MLSADRSAAARALGIDCHHIYGTVYQGSLPPPGGALRRAGFNALVLAAVEHQRASDYPGVSVLCSALDDAIPTKSEIARIWHAARWVAQRQARGAAALVTCHAGRNRSGIIVAASMMIGRKLRADDAIEVVQRLRPNALSNPHFRRHLRVAERAARRHPLLLSALAMP